jgi:hypothetical protein
MVSYHCDHNLTVPINIVKWERNIPHVLSALMALEPDPSIRQAQSGMILPNEELIRESIPRIPSLHLSEGESNNCGLDTGCQVCSWTSIGIQVPRWGSRNVSESCAPA